MNCLNLKHLVVFSIISICPAVAADHYVRSGGTCTSGCSSWANASGQITTALANASRGDTIWVADGSYNSIRLDKATSGSTVITIKKATESSHGTNTGWSTAYGDGQATISSITAISNYWLIDGQTRNENDWSEVSAYGFRLPGGVHANTLSYGAGSSYMTFKYVDVGLNLSSNYTGGESDAFYLGGFGSILRNWTVSRCHIHNTRLAFQLAGASTITIEYCHIQNGWQKESIRGQIHASYIIIRHNTFRNTCQGVPGDPTAGGCTAIVAMWGGTAAGAHDGSEIYGNVFWTEKSTYHSDGCIMIGGDGGVTAHGVAANNVLVYNNSFAGIKDGSCTIRFPGSHVGDIAQNNIWYGLGTGVSSGCSNANTCSHNSTAVSSNLFLNASIGDFRLAGPTAVGVSLPSPYNTDRTGVVRGADGVWDQGAFELGGSIIISPASSLSAVVK